MRILAPVLLLPLAACVVTPEPNAPVGHVCSDASLSSFAGEPASTELGGRMLAASGATNLRWVPKGGVVTMDFRADRLTVQLSSDNKVETVRCG